MNENPSRINAAPKCTSNTYHVHFPSVISTSNTSFSISGNNIETTKAEDAIINKDKQIKTETSLESTHEQKLNKNLPLQTKGNLLESGREIPRKRPLDRGDTLNIDSQKTFVNKFSLHENYQGELKKDKNLNFSINGRNIYNYTFANAGYSTQSFDRTKSLPLQNIANVNKETINKSIGNKSMQNFPNFTGMPKKQVKTVRFLDKENENSCKTQLHEINIIRPHLTKKQNPQIISSLNRKQNLGTVTERNIFEGYNQGNILKLYINKNNLPVTTAENKNAPRPGCYRLPPHTPFKNRNLLPIYRYQANYWKRGITGTATRNSGQNVRMIFPQQLNKQYLVNNTANHLSTFQSPFAFSRVKRDVHGNKQSIKILNGLDHTFPSENSRKHINSVNQTFTENGQANYDGRSNEHHIFTVQSNDNLTSRNSTEKTRAADVMSKVCQSTDRETGSDVEHKIQETNMMLSKISELLQNVNKELLCGFECPGLELSLPIWRAELEQCILSVEKIKSAISQYQDQKR